jgi:hypothetical protein
LRTTVTETEKATKELCNDEAMVRRALSLLDERHGDNYAAALQALPEDSRDWWAETIAEPDEPDEGEEPPTADSASLQRFLVEDVLPWLEKRKRELANRPLIREQALGEALDPGRLQRFGRYEVHLDRKLERMLTMLLRFKDLRQNETIE